jgi:hypothetical protein
VPEPRRIGFAARSGRVISCRQPRDAPEDAAPTSNSTPSSTIAYRLPALTRDLDSGFNLFGFRAARFGRFYGASPY